MVAKRRNRQKTRRRFFFSFVKRVFDVIFASVVLFFAFPLFLLIAFFVKWDSPGPIFFRQIRIGKGGKPFIIYKFRTMHANTHPYAFKPDDDEADCRVTRVGCILRQSGLDELPQFFNVLKGEMSIVGPRPEMPFIVEKYTPRQRKRLQVLPGITGLWQISPVRNKPIHENLRYDYYYITHQSLRLDFFIVGSTFLLISKNSVTGLVKAVKWLWWKEKTIEVSQE